MLKKPSGRQVDDDFAVEGRSQAAVPDGRPNPLTRLLDRGVRETNDRGRRHLRSGDIDFNFNELAFEPDDRAAEDACEHPRGLW